MMGERERKGGSHWFGWRGSGLGDGVTMADLMRWTMAVAEKDDAGGVKEAPHLRSSGMGDEDDHVGAPGRLLVARGGWWPRQWRAAATAALGSRVRCEGEGEGRVS